MSNQTSKVSAYCKVVVPTRNEQLVIIKKNNDEFKEILYKSFKKIDLSLVKKEYAVFETQPYSLNRDKILKIFFYSEKEQNQGLRIQASTDIFNNTSIPIEVVFRFPKRITITKRSFPLPFEFTHIAILAEFRRAMLNLLCCYKKTNPNYLLPALCVDIIKIYFDIHYECLKIIEPSSVLAQITCFCDQRVIVESTYQPKIEEYCRCQFCSTQKVLNVACKHKWNTVNFVKVLRFDNLEKTRLDLDQKKAICLDMPVDVNLHRVNTLYSSPSVPCVGVIVQRYNEIISSNRLSKIEYSLCDLFKLVDYVGIKKTILSKSGKEVPVVCFMCSTCNGIESRLKRSVQTTINSFKQNVNKEVKKLKRDISTVYENESILNTNRNKKLKSKKMQNFE